ncbi:unnamed protein product [Cuscuta europaea]|uniref:Uncharacterized protein n=1 Tax=Cuscuta europaea TaxID=41803 RepID=A0A9P0Z8W9_CUSEU|nr:unnamed protein product [Cuscuta europaea]
MLATQNFPKRKNGDNFLGRPKKRDLFYGTQRVINNRKSFSNPNTSFNPFRWFRRSPDYQYCCDFHHRPNSGPPYSSPCAFARHRQQSPVVVLCIDDPRPMKHSYFQILKLQQAEQSQSNREHKTRSRNQI